MNIILKKRKVGLYDDYIKVIKDNKVIHDGSIYFLSSDKKNEIGLELNYGTSEHYSTIFFREFMNNYYSIPDKENMFLFVYQYEALQLSEQNLKELLFGIDEIKKIRKINTNDIIMNWLCTSSFKNYYLNLDDYIFYLIKDIYFIDEEKMNKDIKKSMNNILNLKEEKIISIKNFDLEEIDVYLNCGIVWKAFVKNKETNDIYLNTGYDISIRIK